MTDREAIRMALEALTWIANVNAMDYEYQRKAREPIKALRQAFAQPEQDWDLLSATQESLREHQARIQELEAQLAQPEPQICCGDYDKCIKACTPRGRWLANKQMTRLEQEKGQFVGGVPSVSQQRQWVGLTDDEIKKIVDLNTSDDGGFDIWCDGIAVAHIVCAKLKEKNT